MLKCSWRFDQADALFQLFYCLSVLLGFLVLHPAQVFHKFVKMKKTKNMLYYFYYRLKLRGKYLFSWCLSSLTILTLSIFLMALRVFSVRFLSYLSGLFLFLSNSKVESYKKMQRVTQDLQDINPAFQQSQYKV